MTQITLSTFMSPSGADDIAVLEGMADETMNGFIDGTCTGPDTPLALDYRLFFAIDPSHRAILASRYGEDVATTLLTPQNARVELKIGGATRAANDEESFEHRRH